MEMSLFKSIFYTKLKIVLIGSEFPIRGLETAVLETAVLETAVLETAVLETAVLETLFFL
jgi:hypothetical protein